MVTELSVSLFELAILHDETRQDHTCGTHFSGTNEPASMVVTPVLASRSINSSLVCIGIDFFSFCSPSRAPTSTMRTWSDVNRDSVAKRRVERGARMAEERRNLKRDKIMSRMVPTRETSLKRILGKLQLRKGEPQGYENGGVIDRDAESAFPLSD